MRRLFATLLLALSACDGDGCHGGASGPATQYCQRSLAGLPDAGGVGLVEACKSCCIQEVPYEGTIEDGQCVCRR